ncbi:MAG: hypothetical protein Q9202_005922 [Teloschistes flavicans]
MQKITWDGIHSSLKLLTKDFHAQRLPDKLLILKLVLSFANVLDRPMFPEVNFSDLLSQVPVLLEDSCKSLSEPVTGTLLQQFVDLQRLLWLHRHRAISGYAVGAVPHPNIMTLVAQHVRHLLAELREYRSETIEMDVAILEAAVDLSQNETRLETYGMREALQALWAQLHSNFQKQEPAEPIDPIDFPENERRHQHEAREKVRIAAEEPKTEERVRGYEETAARRASAEQLEHAEPAKKAKVEDKRARKKVKKTVQDDGPKVKTRAERLQKRLARKATEEHEQLRHAGKNVKAKVGEGKDIGDDEMDEGEGVDGGKQA